MRPGINLATPLPEGAADVLFSCAGRSYQLKLNNCVKLPGHGWVLGADIELIDLAAQAEAEKAGPRISPPPNYVPPSKRNGCS